MIEKILRINLREKILQVMVTDERDEFKNKMRGYFKILIV
jgi:hypothetical protein